MSLWYLLIPVALLVFSVVLSIVLVKRGTPAKKALAVHFLSVVAIMILTCLLPMGAAAAEDAAPQETEPRRRIPKTSVNPSSLWHWERASACTAFSSPL